MKFSLAWANVLTQNMWLKFVIIFFSILSSILAISTVILSQKDPLIIDRECFSKAIKPSSTDHPTSEIETFIAVSLSQRFDTKVKSMSDLLSDDEQNSRKQEQKEFDSKGMSQKVIVDDVKIDSNTVKVEAMRLISVGQIRSALPFPLEIKIASTDRTPENPYGLRLLKVSQTKSDLK